MHMRNLICLFAALTVLANTACTTTTTWGGAEVAELEQAIKPGDRLSIVETDGSEYELLVESVSAMALVGERAYLGRVEVPMDRVASVEITKIAPVRTAGAIVGGSVLAVVAGALVVGAAMTGAMGPASY